MATKNLMNEMENMKEKDNTTVEEENFQQLLKVLSKLKIKMMVKEMLAQSLCCVKFLKDILMLKVMSFDEELFSTTKNCRVIFKRKPPLKVRGSWLLQYYSLHW